MWPAPRRAAPPAAHLWRRVMLPLRPPLATMLLTGGHCPPPTPVPAEDGHPGELDHRIAPITAPCVIGLHRFQHALLRLGGLHKTLVIEREVQQGIEALGGVASLRELRQPALVSQTAGKEELLGGAHDGTAVRPHGELEGPRGLQPTHHLRQADQVPDLLLRVVAVDLDVGRELLGAIGKTLRIVQCQATLPQVGLRRRVRADDRVIQFDCFFHSVVGERRHPLPHRIRCLSSQRHCG
mmetsp:Transcript_18276/g.59814  ORF Transcript_18276/g.59814 Transcript_18276/m.59814 type:complete len:239 (+) Transcript_18276:99-815(+)